MSIRHHDKSGRPAGRPDLAPESFPALTAFFGGYLHQDLVPVHGSADQAARAFAEDADEAGREAVRQELQRLIVFVRGRGPGVLRRAVQNLGAAWSPSSLADVERLLDQLGERGPGQRGRG